MTDSKIIVNKHRTRKILLVVFVCLIIVLVVLGYVGYKQLFAPAPTSTNGNKQEWQPITVNSQNLPSVLGSTNIVADVPDEGLIALTIGSSEYTIKKDSVVPGAPTNPDVKITLPEKYFELIGTKGICGAIMIASQNNELGLEFIGSEVSLAWKYRALGKYRSCLG